jgi:hypothetical protein
MITIPTVLHQYLSHPTDNIILPCPDINQVGFFAFPGIQTYLNNGSGLGLSGSGSNVYVSSSGPSMSYSSSLHQPGLNRNNNTTTNQTTSPQHPSANKGRILSRVLLSPESNSTISHVLPIVPQFIISRDQIYPIIVTSRENPTALKQHSFTTSSSCQEDIPSICHHPPLYNNHITTISNTNPPVNTAYLSITHPVWIPKSITSISKSPTPEKWTLALENEINSMISQNVFDITPIDITTIDPKLIIPSRVIFDTRMNADGSINKYKARLVAQGNHQNESTYFDTFADTASAKSINILLSIAAAENLEMISLDVKTAFLYSPLKETLYLKRPPGLSPNIMPSIVKLNKCLYGLKQAAHEWRQLLDITLKGFGFTQFQTDACLYKILLPFNNIVHTLILGVFVDDILCLSTHLSIIDWFQTQMSSKFTITIKTVVDSFLGMQITRNRSNKTISLSQPGYITSLMTRFNINTDSTIHYPNTPMSSTDLQDALQIPLSVPQQSTFMKIVGSVLFLSTRSRPDIAFVVNYLSLFMTKATQHHLDLGIKLLKYIWKSKDLTLNFNGQNGINFQVMVDSSYASHLDRKSHYGISIHMNSSSGSCISISKKSTILALSSTEAEYIGMYEASKIIMWLRQLLNELGYPPTSPTLLFEDNKSAIHIVTNGNDKGRTKHMDVRCHLIRELVKTNIIQIHYQPTETMIADILTKPLDPKLFTTLQAKLLGHLV